MGAFNLLTAPWLPVRRRSGNQEWIRPTQVTDRLAEDPVVGFAWGRPDFDAAAHEFIIGLLATALAPPEDDWKDYWQAPPSPEKLDAAFAPWTPCFNLDGDGPCFMQDMDPLEDAEQKDISGLFIDAPGEKTLKDNTDHFIKRGRTPHLARATAAMALFTLQTHAPSGGVGHRTSLRGGGPLITLLEPSDQDSLWHRLWLAVESRESIEERNNAGYKPATPEHIFPWMAPTRTSDPKAKGVDTTATDVHALHVYWGMPRRIRLLFEPALGEVCALTGLSDAVMVSSYRAKNYGVNYTDGFLHPLTPHYRPKEGQAWLPVHGQPGGIGYRHWLGLAMESAQGLREPARAVVAAKRRLGRQQRWLRLSISGYDMDNMKPRGYVASELPIWVGPEDRRKAVHALAGALIEATQQTALFMSGAIKSALFENPKDARGDMSFHGERLWRDTEADFYARLEQLGALDLGKPNADIAIRQQWLGDLRRHALKIFDEVVAVDALVARDMARITTARRNLQWALAGYGKGGGALCGTLGIPTPEAKSKQPKSKTAKTVTEARA